MLDDVELCHAQYDEPAPDALRPVAVRMSNWTWPRSADVTPKWAAARPASAARSDWDGLDGAAFVVSNHVPPSTLLGLVAWTRPAAHVVLPTDPPWQYCVTELFQPLPPTWLKKLWRSPTSPDGSFEPLLPQPL